MLSAVDARAGARGQLVVQLGRLLLLYPCVRVERPAALLNATVDAVDALVAALLRHPLAVALGRLDMHAQHERARRLHHVKQPPEPRLLRREADVEDLLQRLTQGDAAAVTEADRRGADRLGQPLRTVARCLCALPRDERRDDVRRHEARGQPARQAAVRVKAAVQ